MSERKRKPKRHIAAGPGYLQDVQIGVAGSRAPDLHQDLTRPGFGKRDLTKFARLLSEASEQVSTPLSMSTSSMCRHVCIHIIENGSPPRKTRATPSLCISMSPRDSMYCGSTLPWASSTSRPRPGSWVPPDQPPTPYVSSNWRRQGSIQMADDSNTSPPTAPPLDDDESNRVSALAALYQAEQSTPSSLDSQVLVLVGLLVTYGIAAVAALGAEKAISAHWMYVALPVPAWILLGYNAILWTKAANHSAAAKVYETALTRIARSGVRDGMPPEINGIVWPVQSSDSPVAVLSYGVAFMVIVVFTAAMLWRGYEPRCWFWSAVAVYGFGLLIISAAWLRIIYAGSPRNWFKWCMDWIFLQRQYRPRHQARSAAQSKAPSSPH